MACQRPGRSPWGRCKYYPPSVARYGVNSANNVFRRAGGKKPHVYRPAAIMLRSYQLGGGYTPGPVLLLALLTGTAGSFTYCRHSPAGAGQALACLLVTGVGAAALFGAGLYKFSWRYQPPALVTLPVAGALGATARVQHARQPRAARKGRIEGYGGNER